MAWHARLDLDYSLEAGRSVARHQHSGPLRILQSLYPEGDAICHNILVHPPGGLVGGDTLDLRIHAQAGAHGLITTPGATRFYRSEGDTALQRAHIALDADARLEWLPLESICYSGCLGENRLQMTLAPGAELLGWDITALGLPAAELPFEKGVFCQHMEVVGVWLERARIQASDNLLLNSPLGLAGHRCLGTLFFVAGSKLDRQRRQRALDLACDVLGGHDLKATSGATSPDGQVVLVRVLSPVVEPAADLLRQVRAAWRQHLWNCTDSAPRIWST